MNKKVIAQFLLFSMRAFAFNCDSDNPEDYVQTNGYFEVFLYHREYQVYPPYTVFKRELLKNLLMERALLNKSDYCVEFKNRRAAKRILENYLNQCMKYDGVEKYTVVSFSRKALAIQVRKSNIISEHHLPVCDWE